jgi:hypothetical protein
MNSASGRYWRVALYTNLLSIWGGYGILGVFINILYEDMFTIVLLISYGNYVCMYSLKKHVHMN